MAHPGNVIRVPRPSRASFDPNRPLTRNQLLEKQVEHFHEVEMKHLPSDRRTGIAVESIRTEGEASAYIAEVTARLHPQAAKREKVRKAT